jgi:hypothetical protein
VIVNFPPPEKLSEYARLIREENARANEEVERRIDHWRRRQRRNLLLLSLQFIVPTLIVALLWWFL